MGSVVYGGHYELAKWWAWGHRLGRRVQQWGQGGVMVSLGGQCSGAHKLGWQALVGAGAAGAAYDQQVGVAVVVAWVPPWASCQVVGGTGGISWTQLGQRRGGQVGWGYPGVGHGLLCWQQGW